MDKRPRLAVNLAHPPFGPSNSNLRGRHLIPLSTTFSEFGHRASEYARPDAPCRERPMYPLRESLPSPDISPWETGLVDGGAAIGAGNGRAPWTDRYAAGMAFTALT